MDEEDGGEGVDMNMSGSSAWKLMRVGQWEGVRVNGRAGWSTYLTGEGSRGRGGDVSVEEVGCAEDAVDSGNGIASGNTGGDGLPSSSLSHTGSNCTQRELVSE